MTEEPTVGEAFRCYFVGPFVSALFVFGAFAWWATRRWLR